MRTLRIFFIGFIIGLAAVFSACSGNGQEVFMDDNTDDPVYYRPNQTAPAVAKPPLPTETPNDGYIYTSEEVNTFDWTGYTPSKLTGLPIPLETAALRPIAIVVNNHSKALPQSGISQADLIYEVLAEGNITRLVAIFQQHDAPRIGPVRSARDYFIDFALDYDAIFVHHGGSPSGYAKLQNMQINRLDGMALEGTYFWRDRTYPSWDRNAGQQRPLEHSSYIKSENILNAVDKMGFRDTLYEDAVFGFTFNTVIPLNESGSADTSAIVVTVPFSSDYTRVFTYDPETASYAVDNRFGPHKDANTGEQLYVANVLIQRVRTHVIAGDEAGRREVSTVGEGGGWLAKGGGYVPIKWKKTASTSPTRWYFEDGTEMCLNIGKTWVCVFQDNGTVTFE